MSAETHPIRQRFFIVERGKQEGQKQKRRRHGRLAAFMVRNQACSPTIAPPLLAIAHLAVLPGLRLQGENELGAIYFSKDASVNSNTLCEEFRL